jgi:hypothetical protein
MLRRGTLLLGKGGVAAAVRKWPHSLAPADEVVVQSQTKNSPV